MAYFTTGAQLQAAINAIPAAAIGSAQTFDPFFYGQTYMSAGKYTGSLSPIDHYVQIGAAMGNKPNANFDPVYYRATSADLLAKDASGQQMVADTDLFYHYLKFGVNEGRVANAEMAAFDGGAYLAAYPDVNTYVQANLAAFGNSANNGALAHYVKFGMAQGFTTTYATAAKLANTLGTGQDAKYGTSNADTFTAPIIDNANTLQSGDFINGGAGNDTLKADIGASQNVIITPETFSVETIAIRGEALQGQAANGSNNIGAVAKIDAERALGVTRWESNKSRGDVIIEDVQVDAGKPTKSVTVAFVDSDPGEVDLGVYFNQFSLRNVNQVGSSTVSFKLRDGLATAAEPLGNLAVNGIRFKVGTTDLLIQDNATSQAINNAKTYVELAAALNAAIARTTGAAGLVATVGDAFTDVNGVATSGNYIIITDSQGRTITNTGGSTTEPVSFAYADNATGAFVMLGSSSSGAAATLSELVTSTVILDNVGSGSTGGDLVIGGMSVGTTSTSRGVERFEITVQDSSKLQTINSTNNALREVTIVSGTTNNTSSAYVTVVSGEGDLTVNGKVGADAALPGVQAGMTAYNNHDVTGFTDVRLIDASTFKGKLAFTAAITSDSIAKYVTAIDTAANPAADVASNTGNVNFNVKGANFAYTGGIDDDTMVVTIDSGVASSRSTVVSGQSDFTFNISGGAGDDAITLSIVDKASLPTLVGNTEAWYTNQALNKNITIDGGDGADTIRTPGAGDKTIDAGAGNDTVYSDNSSSIVNTWATAIAATGGAPVVNANNAVWVYNATAAAGKTLANLESTANTTYGMFGSTAQVTYRGLTSAAITVANNDYKSSDLQINQAIKAGINSDAVLSKLLLAQDGPANTLVITSLTDGTRVVADLDVTFKASTTAVSATDAAAYLAANPAMVVAVAGTATSAEVLADMAANVVTLNAAADYNAAFAIGTDAANLVGVASATSTDNTITPGVGNDVIVLSTTTLLTALASSNETIVFSGSFGSDTVVNFTAGAAATGGDILSLKALGGVTNASFSNAVGVVGAVAVAGATASKTIIIDDLVAGAGVVAGTNNSTAALVASLFADSGTATAKTFVYVAVDTATNIGSVYSVADPVAGTAAAITVAAGSNVTATLMGTIDLADTLWATLTAANFA